MNGPLKEAVFFGHNRRLLNRFNSLFLTGRVAKLLLK